MMLEKRFWDAYVKPALNSPPRYTARKVQDHFHRGLPDVLWVMRGKTGMLELKRMKQRPQRPNSMLALGFTKEQRSWLVAGRRAGGSFWGLAAIEKRWYLFDPLEMVEVDWIVRNHELEESPPTIVLSGDIVRGGLAPLREFLLSWSPPEELR